MRARDPGVIVLFEDETDLRLFPPLRAGWALRGRPVRVPLHGGNAKRVVFGTLNPRTGHRVFAVTERQRAADFQNFLRRLRRRYGRRRLLLLVDEDPSHTAIRSQEVAAELAIELVFLPKRSPHLNPLEPLWGEGKQKVCANRQYRSPDEQAARFVRHLRRLPAHQALRKAGVLSKRFWLRRSL